MGDAIKITKKFVNYLKEVGIPVEKTLVFGSHAKGTSNLYSDIDVCIVSSVFGKDNYDETVDLRKKALKIDDRLEPVAFSSDDLNDPYSTLASEIRKFGIVV